MRTIAFLPLYRANHFRCYAAIACGIGLLAMLPLGARIAQAQQAADEEAGVVEQPLEPGDEGYVPATPAPSALVNPAVRAVLNGSRQTAADYLKSTHLLLDLGQPALAAGEFHRLLQLNPNDATKVELVNQFGPAIIQQLARSPELGPKARPFAESLLAASQQAAQSVERIKAMIDQLGSDDKVARSRAVAALAGAGEVAVVPLIELLGGTDASDTARVGARASLMRLAPYAERPLMATLDSADSKLVDEAATLLAAIGSGDAAPLLAAPALTGGAAAQAYQQLTGQAPSAESAAGLLERTMKVIEGGSPVFEPDFEGKVKYWVWDSKGTPGPKALSLSTAESDTLYMDKLATALATVRPELPSAESQAIRLQFEAIDVLGRHGFAMAYPMEQLTQLPADSLNQLLTDALKHNQSAAARMALQVIADRGDAGMLATSNGQPSPTAKALVHPHPSVRAAAVEAIAAIDPATPFPGSSKLCPAIVKLASSRGQRLALGASPRIGTAATWAGGLTSIGLASEVANSGKQLFEKADLLADVELIVIDMNLNHPSVRDVVYQLRINPSTALVPIALIARESQLSSARLIATEHKAVGAFLRPHDDQTMEMLVRTMLAQLPPDWPTAEQRFEQRVAAIKAMNHLMDNDRTFYRLRSASSEITQSVYPETDDAWQLLSRLGTHDSQVALLAYASTTTEQIESRQAAAKAFADSVGRFGLRITAEEIVHQYDLYNASARDTKASQQVLGDLLDTIEQGRTNESEQE
ncbi:HEAT repeat domain-containing protein [Aeoliella mucimassa]|uniref:HEAT repeat protein n=1 Tax=Aeoliella mucimassa TaxID=2527972 RepID=A0A518AGJ9_9BACT|nr:hypothetical protein [Aeoliella mucimassa]QDU53851.1 hypothetical protein Pan181_00290 [Aeoliella mucimassa]